MVNPAKCLLPGLVALASSVPALAIDRVHILSSWAGVLHLHVGQPSGSGADRARLSLQEYDLEAEGKPLGHAKALDLGDTALLPRFSLNRNRAFELCCIHLSGTSVTVPIQLTGIDPEKAEPIAIGLVLSSKGGEARLDPDPAYQDRQVPLRLLRLEPDSDLPEADQLAGIAIEPLAGRELHHRLRSMPNMSSVSSRGGTPGDCTCDWTCIIL
jgi:hypothetical protein